MSDFPTNLDPKRNLASTYQEVLKHQEQLADMIPFIEILKNTMIGGGGKPGTDIGTGDVIIDDKGDARVPGMTIIVNNTNVNQPPNDYKHDITYEVKDKEVIQLPETNSSGETVIVNKYVTVMTNSGKHTEIIVNPDGTTSEVTYPAWQIAYGDEDGHLYMYYRTEQEDGTWGPWTTVFDLKVMLEKNPEIVEKFSHRQVKESATLPMDQEIDDYWFWPIVKGVDPILGAPGITDITDIPIPDIPDGYFFQSLDDPYEKYPCPGDGINDAFVFQDPDTENFLIPDETDKDDIFNLGEPDPGFVGYYWVNLENPSDILYYSEDIREEFGLYIVGALWLDMNGKPIDPLDPDNDGIYTGVDPDNRPEVEDGKGPGVPDPDKGMASCECGRPDCTCTDYPFDPDGQKPGDKVDQEIADDIDIYDIDTDEPIDHIYNKFSAEYWLLDPTNSKNDVELTNKELKNYVVLTWPGGVLDESGKLQDYIITNLGNVDETENPAGSYVLINPALAGDETNVTFAEREKINLLGLLGGDEDTSEDFRMMDIDT